MNEKELLKKAARTLGDLIAMPARVYAQIISEEKQSFISALLVYAAYISAYGVFYALKPLDFPADAAQLGITRLNLFSWIYTELVWGNLFTICWIFFISLFSELAKRLRLPGFFAWAMALLLIPAFMIMMLQSGELKSAALVGAFLAVFFGGLWYYFVPFEFPYIKIAALVLLLNGLSLVFLPLQAFNIAIRWENGYMLAQFVCAFWMLGLGAMGLKSINNTSAARSSLTLLFALMATFEVVFASFKLGLISQDTLKVFFLN